MTSKTLLAVVAVIFLAASCNQVAVDPSKRQITIAGHMINVEVAVTPLTQELGLGGRASLPENDGMLFVFNSPGRPAFWMKGMQFDLDFIWIKDHRVVEITSNVKTQPGVADSQLATFMPKDAVDSMLEINAGWAQRHYIQVGDSVDGPK